MPDDLDAAVSASEQRWQTVRNQQQQLRWEEAVVRRLLTEGGAPQLATGLMQRVRDATGEPHLYFSVFHAHFPTFPLWCHCARIPYVFQMTIQELYDVSKQRRSKLYKHYVKETQQTPDFWGSRPVGLVFEWLHSGGRFKIMHNLARPLTCAGGRFQFNVREADELNHYYIDNLSTFLENIGWVGSLRE